VLSFALALDLGKKMSGIVGVTIGDLGRKFLSDGKATFFDFRPCDNS
jgi:hypothetical protein